MRSEVQAARNFAAEFAALADELEDSEGMGDTLRRVAELARRRLPGCDDAVVVTRAPDRARTIAATSEPLRALDELQYLHGVGPCLEALVYREPRRIDDTTVETRWPRFTSDAADAGFRSLLTLPLGLAARATGALSLYSRRPSAFVNTAHDLALIFAAEGGIALAHADVYYASRRVVQELGKALETRGVVEQAKGILMAREAINDDEAFNRLRRTSQNRNVKLRDVAAEVIQAELERHR